jgi:SAM-dependent methyltransferase
MDRRAHWEQIYRTKQPHEVSWYQREAVVSLDLIARVAPETGATIIDIGGGASTLVDGLLDRGYSRVTVLDVAAAALAHSRERLGPRAGSVEWIEADVLTADLPAATYSLWHDRAVFHFLTDAADRGTYSRQLRGAVQPGGHVLVSTFADDGPEKCSGLSVARYSPDRLCAEFGSGFEMIECVREEHQTPWGAGQAFVYCLFRYSLPA